jgi:hypothetical protein
MKSIRFRSIALLFATLALLASAGIGQQKNWQDWTKAEADKILKNSGWVQSQTDTDTSEMVYSPTNTGRSSIGASPTARANELQGINNSRADRGANNQAVSVNYRIRLLSAKPIREALMREIAIEQKSTDKAFIEGLNAFVERDFSDYIVVAVTVDSVDGRLLGPALQAFGSQRVGTLKNVTYLERKDGKRVFPIEYYPPIKDGLGAKFVFPRRVDERLFLGTDSGSFRFYCELSPQIKLNVTFKLSDMMYDGKLEY